MSLWRLQNIETKEYLNDPQPLPENWGSIFGLSGIVDKLSDLSWLGEDYEGQGWVKVSDAPANIATSTPEQIAWETAKQLLRDSDWAVLPDVPMVSETKVAWIEYRKATREIRLHSDFPNMVWPNGPE
jgi:hypothetical protein